MSTSNIINIVGNVVNPPSTNQPDQATPMLSTGRQAEVLISEVHGKFYSAAYRGKVFEANVTAQTIPVVGANKALKFSLWNPFSSGIIGELISASIDSTLVTVVVDVYGWYSTTYTSWAASTALTIGTPVSARVGDSPSNGIVFYSAASLSNDSVVPFRVATIGSHAAAGVTGPASAKREYDGTMLLMPGNVITVMTSTTVSTTSALDVSATWAEWQI